MGGDGVRPPPHVRGAFELRRFASDATLVVGAAIAGNLFSFVFHFTLSRRLGPDGYGTLVTLIAISSMLGALAYSVGTVAMQETAQMWASHLDAATASFVRHTGRLVALAALGVALALVIATLPLRHYLHVTESVLWWMLGAYVAARESREYLRGAAQGAHRFGIFAASLVCEGAAKVAISLAAVALGYGVAGALGGLIASAAIAIAIVYLPLVKAGGREARPADERLRLGREALKVLAVTATSSSLLFIDMVFAKHHFSGELAGYFGAAGTVARTIPLGVGLLGMIVMPKAAAARHVGRESLGRVLGLAALLAGALVALAFAVLAWLPAQIIGVTYGATFAGAAPLLRIYACDEALLGLWVIAIGYLVAVASYKVFWLLAAAVVVEVAAMALYGSTPLRLLSIGIVVNALLVPGVWALAVGTLRGAPQAGGPPLAEAS